MSEVQHLKKPVMSSPDEHRQCDNWTLGLVSLGQMVLGVNKFLPAPRLSLGFEGFFVQCKRHESTIAPVATVGHRLGGRQGATCFVQLLYQLG